MKFLIVEANDDRYQMLAREILARSNGREIEVVRERDPRNALALLEAGTGITEVCYASSVCGRQEAIDRLRVATNRNLAAAR